MDHTSSATTLIRFLEGSINILVVDDDLSMVELFLEHLNSYRLYNVTRAFCTKEADSILSSSKRYHVCLLDLGLNDINNDEYYLMKKFSPKISFIVVTARDSLDKGFQARDCGAIAAIKKPVDFYNLDIFNLINGAFIRSLITPENINECKQVIQSAVKTFITLKPTSVMQWAEKIGIEKRYFRNVWNECFGYKPKHAIWLYRMFCNAFSHYNFLYCKRFGLGKKADDAQLKGAECINKLFDRYYYRYSQELNRILTL